MPLILPGGLPAIDILKRENIFIRDVSQGQGSVERRLRIVILNLMPLKEVTETDFVRHAVQQSASVGNLFHEATESCLQAYDSGTHEEVLP